MFGVFSRSPEVSGASFNRPRCLARADVDRSDGLALLQLEGGATLELGLGCVTDMPPT